MNNNDVRMKMAEWYGEKFDECKPDYFMTVTFNKKLQSYDKEISYFLREMHKSIFGVNFIRKKLFLPIVMTREVGGISDRSHYHLAINASKYDLHKGHIVNGFVDASRKSSAIKSIKDKEIQLLTLNRQKINKPHVTLLHKKHGSVRFPLSCTPIALITEHMVFGYMTKDVHANDNPVWVNGGESDIDRKEYFNIAT